ncbi:MAG: PASTA domain-containing protein [Spirochaetales bacterium]|nr:PASTA domain-containing protein [Spirochaetales bacterium]
MFSLFEKIKQIFPGASDAPETRDFKIAIFLLSSLLVVIVIIALFTFFIVLQGGHVTTVPDLIGKDIVEGLKLLQAKNLIAEVDERFTDSPAEKGKIVDQDPPYTTEVREGQTIKLMISKGAPVDRVGNYVGKSLNEVKALLKAHFATAETQLIQISDTYIMYKHDELPAGTIIAQKPEPDTPLSDDVITLQLVVSKGGGKKMIQVSKYTGKNFAQAVNELNQAGIPYIFVVKSAEGGEQNGVVVAQSPESGNSIPEGMLVSLEMTKPANVPSGNVFGVFRAKVPNFDVLTNVEVVAVSGQARTVLMSMMHPGGTLSIPYILDKDAEIVLNINGSQYLKKQVEAF